jgi:hypothetical protein
LTKKTIATLAAKEMEEPHNNKITLQVEDVGFDRCSTSRVRKKEELLSIFP